VRNGVEVESYLSIQKSITPGLVIGIGRIAKNKGIDQVIRAIADVSRSHANVKLVWVGADVEHRLASLEELARELGIAERVQFVGGITSEQLRDILGKAHIFVSGSAYEGYGLSTIEAMSSGTVPVVTRVGIHPQLVDNGNNGFLVDGDPISIANGLRKALDLGSTTLANMGKAAQEVSAKCSWRAAVQPYLDIYRAVAS
jgi:alpha-1,3-mannosyltransferase